jgi:hypothetical protein
MNAYQELREQCHDRILGMMLGAELHGRQLGTHEVFDGVIDAIVNTGGVIAVPVKASSLPDQGKCLVQGRRVVTSPSDGWVHLRIAQPADFGVEFGFDINDDPNSFVFVDALGDGEL